MLIANESTNKVVKNKSKPNIMTIVLSTEEPTSPIATNMTRVQPTQSEQIKNWDRRNTTFTGIAGTLLFTYGGMDMAQGLGWNQGTAVATTYEFQYSWFIGVIIGAVVTAVTVTHIPKWVYYALGGVMELIDAIICVSAPYDYASMLASRYVGGVGMGLITVVFIIHNSEIAASNVRGQCIAFEQYGLAMGIVVQVIMASKWTPHLSIGINQLHGIFGIILSFIATFSVLLSIESPIFYLRKNNEQQARICQYRLTSQLAPPWACNRALDEAKRYVAESSSVSIGSELLNSLLPFIKMIFCRCLVAFSFSLPLSWAMLNSTILNEAFLGWPIILWPILRTLGTIMTIIFVDLLGRKFISMLGLICMVALILTLAAFSANLTHNIDWYSLIQTCRISMAFQFFAGIYVANTSTYLGEAFPMRVKPYCIGLIVCLEQMIHVIVIVTFQATSFENYYNYFLGVGIVLLISLIIFVILMPETRGLTLRQAGKRFQRSHDIFAY